MYLGIPPLFSGTVASSRSDPRLPRIDSTGSVVVGCVALFSLVGLSTSAPPSGGAAPRALPLPVSDRLAACGLPPRSRAVGVRGCCVARTQGRSREAPSADCFASRLRTRVAGTHLIALKDQANVARVPRSGCIAADASSRRRQPSPPQGWHRHERVRRDRRW